MAPYGTPQLLEARRGAGQLRRRLDFCFRRNKKNLEKKKMDSAEKPSDSTGNISVPSSWRELSALSMKELRRLAHALEVTVAGGVTKVDLQYALCQKLGISTSGPLDGGDSRLQKASIPQEILPFYLEVGDLAHVCSAKNVHWTSDLRGVPSGFSRELLEGYLLNSPDKEFDGESLKSYKALRAYQLFEERHIHDVQFCPQWPRREQSSTEESPLCFLGCKCFPSQDTSKQPYRVVVCLNKINGVPYGAHCRGVSGLGEACSHVAGLLFALEDFVARGFHTLKDCQSTTDVLCAWNAPKSRKVEPLPLRDVPVVKAVSGGRKETTKWDRELCLSNYDPRSRKDRKTGMEGLLKVAHAFSEQKAGDCSFARFVTHKRKHPDLESGPTDYPTQPVCLPEHGVDEDIPVSAVVEVEFDCGVHKSERDDLIAERQSKLLAVAGVLPVSDSATVDDLSQHVIRVEDKLRLSVPERNMLESTTRAQADSDTWHAEHVGRITASIAHRAMTGAKSRAPDRLVADIMKYHGHGNKRLHSTDPRQHGIQTEPMAREAHVKYKAEKGTPVTVEERGLFVSISHPILASSTDGVVMDASADGNGVLEIKCPVGGKTVEELAATRKHFCLKKSTSSGRLSLRRSHPYFTQLQFEMAVTGHKWADFVVFSLGEDTHDLFVERVLFCEEFWAKSLFPALQNFVRVLVLELLTRRVRRGVPYYHSSKKEKEKVVLHLNRVISLLVFFLFLSLPRQILLCLFFLASCLSTRTLKSYLQ